MRPFAFQAFLTVVLLFTVSCATIVSKNKYPVLIDSEPRGATITILNKKGNKVYVGQTPATVTLRSGRGYFGKALYQVTFEKEGYLDKMAPIEFTLDPWYLGNIVFGGLLGILIVDPATGAMYKLKTPFLSVILTKEWSSLDHPQLKIYDINDIPDSWKSMLVGINE